ncbi:Protein indeterminate-domain 7 [Abeliophyllum distichum]|uniref:Protein indeterminate-domain 7 n=1 Tax=Abeliophyllum distichum TaxID=126358 RepID=A0ABD1Q8N6_9LAMI
MLQGMLVDDSMSNLTSASNEASISSSNRTEIATTVYPQQSFAISPDNPTRPPPKKKRNLPGNPDPEAEVVALSPKSLLATNRFLCEICNKGFQRDQNLQLHRRGHNLPWKLKQRNNKEVVKKKVYVCPEPSCVHHDPSRALGDLTGIKKHFSRKHGEKKWKCEKCSKRYAVQSDWKAHSKICGTREYRCDCGTLFSRRDSFITHRAFCDALAEESARSMTQMNPLLSSQPGTSSTTHPPHLHGFQPFSLKEEQQIFSSRTEIPPWMTVESGLGAPGPSPFTSSRLEQSILHQENTNPKNPTFSSGLNPSPHMSATALLQKAAQIGVTMSSSNSKPCTSQSDGIFRAHLAHMGAPGFSATSLASSTAGAGLGLSSSREEIATGFVNVTSGCMDLVGANVGANSLLHDMNIMTSLPPNSGFEGSSAFEDTFNRFMNSKGDNNFQENLSNPGTSHLNVSKEAATAVGGGGNDGLTRDFLGLRAFPHRDFLNMAGFNQMGSSSYDPQSHTHQNQPPWQS